MASPDTIILLIVDYHAAVGGKTPVVLLHTPQNTVASNVAVTTAMRVRFDRLATPVQRAPRGSRKRSYGSRAVVESIKIFIVA